ncbi:GDSL Lipase/Acylhydrolase family protein [Metarhizium brunneum]
MPDLQAHFTQDGKWTMEASNLAFVCTFDGWQGNYYTYLTCITREEELRRLKEDQKVNSRLQKIVPKTGQPTGPSPGFYKADKPPYTNCPTPSFFFIDDRQENPIHRVEDIDYLSWRYLQQFARDTEVDTVNIDLVEEAVEEPLVEGQTLGLYRTHEDEKGCQRAWVFSTNRYALTWRHTTLFHGAFL